MMRGKYNQKVFGCLLALFMSSCVFGGQVDELLAPLDGECADPHFATPSCTMCLPAFTGANCDQCSDARFTGVNCDQCSDPHFATPSCTMCLPAFTGANCDQCSEGFTGANCDQCSDARFTGANCDQASATYQMTLGIKWLQSSANNLYFMKTEVTVAQYVACVTAESCTLSNHDTTWNNSDCNYGSSSRSDHPMNCVNWNGAGEYCTWVGARLPTEDEWYAEASNNGSRTYPWGDTPKPDCDYSVMRDDSAGGDGCGNNSTMPVGSKPLGDSVSGVSDLSGNVWEWTKTESYPGTASARRVIRGGSWRSAAQSNLQASARSSYGPGARDDFYGFRCVSVSAP